MGHYRSEMLGASDEEDYQKQRKAARKAIALLEKAQEQVDDLEDETIKSRISAHISDAEAHLNAWLS